MTALGSRIALALVMAAGCGGCAGTSVPEPAAPKPVEEPKPAAEPFEPLLPPAPVAPPGEPLFLPPQPQAPPPPPVPEDLRTPPAEAHKTSSGLRYRVLQPGTGTEHPRGRSVVEVHYSGWTQNGKMFDSSVVRGQAVAFRLDQLIRGWSEGLQLMVVGEKVRFWIPAHLAYGENPAPGTPAGPLVFDVELLDIKPPGTSTQ